MSGICMQVARRSPSGTQQPPRRSSRVLIVPFRIGCSWLKHTDLPLHIGEATARVAGSCQTQSEQDFDEMKPQSRRGVHLHDERETCSWFVEVEVSFHLFTHW